MLLVLGATAQSASEPAPAPAREPTVQQQFDAGGAALDAREWQKAFDIYSALESAFVAKNPDSKSLPVVRVRKGRALLGLGRSEEAESLIADTLDVLPETPELSDDRYHALRALSLIAEEQFDYPQAVALLRQAAAATDDPVFKIYALVRALPIAIFVDPQSGLRDAGAAQAVVDSTKGLSREWAGLIHNYRGRTLMNMGQLKEARTELDASIKLLGGLSYGKVNMFDVAARSDAAIAAILDNEPDRARELLTYAGAAETADRGFTYARSMTPPSCDIEGLKPDDVAVVEFRIDDDGSVSAALPIYFSGKPSLAVEFARAASRWSWNAEELRSLGSFFRAQARVELRCTRAFQSPGSTDLLLPAVQKWLVKQLVVPSAVSSDQSAAARLVALKAELQARQSESGDASPALIPTLSALAENPIIPLKEAKAFAQRAYEIAKTRGAAGEVLAWFLLRYWSADPTRWKASYGTYHRQLSLALSDPAIAVDPRADAAIRISLFDNLNAANRKTKGRAFIEPLAASKQLSATDEFRVGARIRLANLDYARGDLEAARAHFQESGVASHQCTLLDAKPALVGRPGVNYPQEARRWGLSGWNRVEFDVSPAGDPLGVRTIAAFPPFVFANTTEKGAKAFRYEKTYRPEGEQGCVANLFNVTYKLD